MFLSAATQRRKNPEKKTHTHMHTLVPFQTASRERTQHTERERESVSESARERGLSGYVSGSGRVRGRAL